MQLQNVATTNESILSQTLIVFPIPEIYTSTTQSILLFNELKLSTTTPHSLNQHLILLLGYSINYILYHLPNTAKLKVKLNNAKIWFTEQLYNSNSLTLLI